MDITRPLRLAVLSDVHGNPWALEAVLTDAQRHRPHGYLLLGDLLADGPAPVRTLDMLQALPNATFIRGNTDRYLADLTQVVSPRAEMPDLIATWRWAVDRLGERGHHFLSGLPGEAVIDTPAGPLLATHGVPGNDEWFILPARPDTWSVLDEVDARLVLVGHTHMPFVLDTGRCTVVNPGSVGLPEPTGWRASYALLDLFPGSRFAIRHVQVPWDTVAYVAAFSGGIPLNRKAAPMLAVLRGQADQNG
jgi:putative phosphoesterase